MKRFNCFFVVCLLVLGCATSNSAVEDSDLNRSSDIALVRQYIQKAKSSGREEKYEEALEYLRKAEKIMPDEEDVLLGIGFTLRKLGLYEDALAYFNKTAEVNPYALPALGSIAEINRDLKRFSEALKAYQNILDLKPNDDIAIANLAHINFRIKAYEDCEKFILLYKNVIENKNVYLMNQRDQERIKKDLDRFEVYMTVIEKERSKDENKLKTSF